MASAPASETTFRRVGKARIEKYEFTLRLNAKDRLAYVRNPRAYFRRIATKLFGRNNGVYIDVDFLDYSVTLFKKAIMQGKDKKCTGVLVHIQQGPDACKVVCVRS